MFIGELGIEVSDLEKPFQTTIQQQAVLLSKYKQQFNLVGYIKLALFILFAVSFYFMVTNWALAFYKIEVLALLVIQIIAWLYHDRLSKLVSHVAGIIEINQRHLDRIEGKWTAFSDTGSEFYDPEHPYCRDLDIVGSKSLFQYLNTAHTWHGRQAFAQDLLHSGYNNQEITNRQEAINELAQTHDLSNELEYLFSRIGNDPSAPALVEQLQDSKPFMHSKILRVLLAYLPLATLLFTGLVAIFKWEKLYLPAVFLFAVQALIWVLGMLSTNKYLTGMQRIPFKMAAYAEVLGFVGNSSFTAKRLQQIQENLSFSDVSARQAMKELARIADKISVRSNGIVYFILNVLLLWDYGCAFQLEAWKKKYAPHCESWFLALGELESLSCFATLNKVCDHICFPQISGQCGAKAVEMGHPLIPNSVRVTNPLHIQNNILVISGSNMSGKTTYLRTVGINLVLAQTGSAVCAKEMSFSCLQIVTSMRVEDNLNEGVSTFYAELRRIKRILDAAKNDHNTLFLIDEIFRGTNSVDRLSGAQTVIRKLNQLGVSGMITTHDLELCDLAQTIPDIQNHSFSEYYANGQICFDYKMRHGKSQTTNAKYLMEMIGII